MMWLATSSSSDAMADGMPLCSVIVFGKKDPLPVVSIECIEEALRSELLSGTSDNVS